MTALPPASPPASRPASPRLASALLLAITAVATPQAAHAELVLGTVGSSEVVFEGLLQGDGNWFRDDVRTLGGRDDRELAIRRAEFALKGDGPGPFDWVIGYDAESERWLDVNLRARFGADDRHALQAGQFKQVNGMEELSSARGNDFVAKATATSTYAIARRAGVGYAYGAEAGGVSVSTFDREITSGQATGRGAGARGWWAPLHGDGQVLHLGATYVTQDPGSAGTRVRARPNADLTELRLVDAGQMDDARRIRTGSLEALWIRGALKLQGEAFRSTVERDTAPAFDSDGAYASVVWNLGGQGWDYRAGLPVTPVPEAGEPPKWQLALRYDRIDLDDAAIRGGRQDAWTVGVNAYLGAHAKAMLNYVHVDSRRAGVDDDPSIVEARIQLHW